MPVGEKLRPAAKVLARLGSFSIGTVYILIGVWAMLALLRLANPAADEERILQRMMEFPLGKVFIAGIALGTAGYILWLIFEAIFDPYDFGSHLKGVIERIGIGLSALAYAVIVSSALEVLLGGGGRGEEEQQLFVGQVLQWPGGEWLVGAAGLTIACTGLYQIKYVYDGDHKRRVQMDKLNGFLRVLVNILSWAGYLARCAILLVLGGFLLRAAWTSDPKEVGDTDSAFDFWGLGGDYFGDVVFSLVALGTISYGVFMYVNGVYFNSKEG